MDIAPCFWSFLSRCCIDGTRRDKRPKALNPNLEPVDVFWLDIRMFQSRDRHPSISPRHVHPGKCKFGKQSNEDPFSFLLICLGKGLVRWSLTRVLNQPISAHQWSAGVSQLWASSKAEKRAHHTECCIACSAFTGIQSTSGHWQRAPDDMNDSAPTCPSGKLGRR